MLDEPRTIPTSWLPRLGRRWILESADEALIDEAVATYNADVEAMLGRPEVEPGQDAPSAEWYEFDDAGAEYELVNTSWARRYCSDEPGNRRRSGQRLLVHDGESDREHERRLRSSVSRDRLHRSQRQLARRFGPDQRLCRCEALRLAGCRVVRHRHGSRQHDRQLRGQHRRLRPTNGRSSATVADRGSVGNQTCVTGSFLRVPYDVEIWVGDDAVTVGTMVVQADNTEPSTLHLDSSSRPPMEASLSEPWEAAARDELDPSWTSWNWNVSHSGPFEAPDLSVGVDFESADSRGRGVLWRSELVQP